MDERYYLVDIHFPRLLTASFVNPAVLERVTRITYRVDLTATPPFRWDVTTRERLLSDLLDTGED